MKTVIVQHEVKNFVEWKKIFDADQPNLEKVGIQLMGLYRSDKNANDVTMIFEIPEDLGLFDKLMSDPQRQAAMKNGGVIGAPAISELNKV